MAILSRFRMTVYAGPEVGRSETLQAALLTTVNAGSRCLLGGVTVVGCPATPKRVPLPGPSLLQSAVVACGGKLADQGDPAAPGVVLGSATPPTPGEAPMVRATFDGWAAGVAPLQDCFRMPETQEFAPSGVLMGALAVSEAFQYFRGRNVAAMRRLAGLSLWRPDVREEWNSRAHSGPDQIWLPEKLWVIGLGHLGQAFLWTLSSLPYGDPRLVALVLQDYDRITQANYSTSLLTGPQDHGRMKTRHLAEVCEGRGFQTVLVERPFDERFEVAPGDPHLAFCGVDNPQARRQLEAPGFPEMIEAGLGHQEEEYLAFALHSFPASRTATETWPNLPGHQPSALLSRPAYQKLLDGVTDKCGLVDVAGATVAVPFVGAAVASLAIAEALRAVMGAHRYEVIHGSFRNPLRRIVKTRNESANVANLGYLSSSS